MFEHVAELSCTERGCVPGHGSHKTIRSFPQEDRPHPTRLGLASDEKIDVTVRSLVAHLLAKLGGAQRGSSPLSANVSRTSDPSQQISSRNWKSSGRPSRPEKTASPRNAARETRQLLQRTAKTHV